MMGKLLAKFKAVRLLILDVDGVLTNGLLYYGNQGLEVKTFHIHDGLGIQLLQKAGIAVAVISGKASDALTRRLQELNISHAYLNQDNKLPAYDALKEKLQLQDHEIAYIGDDIPDLPLLMRVGLAITVPHAPDIIQQHTHLITKKKAGKGAVREICELILQAQGRYQAVIESYLQHPVHQDHE